jgi:hypothetical protein
MAARVGKQLALLPTNGVCASGGEHAAFTSPPGATTAPAARAGTSFWLRTRCPSQDRVKEGWSSVIRFTG